MNEDTERGEKMELKELFAKLSNAHGISGYEDDIREIVREELEDRVDEIRVDALGNVICVKNGSELELMIAAHMDEIGFMVKHIDDRGFIRITPIGGWFDQTVLNQRIILHGSKERVYGVIGCKPPHLMREDEKKKVVKLREMFVDIGASSKDEVIEMGINIGTPATIDREVALLGVKRVTGKAFDNRAGLVAMIEAMKQTKSDATIYAVGTVQEEVGLKGARTSAFAIEPHAAIATDVCIATDFPGSDTHVDIQLGKGATITVVDAAGRGLIASKKVIEWLKNTAKKNGIPYQIEVAEGGTTDATAIHLTKAGIPTGVVSVPTRYVHTPVEILDLEDLKNASLLVARALETAKDYFKP
jgi:endoglucanase